VRRNNRSRWLRSGRRRHYRLRHRWCDYRPDDSSRRHCHTRLFRRSMRHRRRRWTRRCGRRRSFLLLRNCSQHIPRTGNVRQVNLGFDFFFAAKRAGTRLASRRRTFRGGTDIHTYFLRFMLFQRTGVRLLLGHPHQRKRIQNSFALDFQLSG
jgi:hypothetical protein